MARGGADHLDISRLIRLLLGAAPGDEVGTGAVKQIQQTRHPAECRLAVHPNRGQNVAQRLQRRCNPIGRAPDSRGNVSHGQARSGLRIRFVRLRAFEHADLIDQSHQQQEIGDGAVVLVRVFGCQRGLRRFLPRQTLGRDLARDALYGAGQDMGDGGDTLAELPIVQGGPAEGRNGGPTHDVNTRTARRVGDHQLQPGFFARSCAGAPQQWRGERDQHPTLLKRHGVVGLDRWQRTFGHAGNPVRMPNGNADGLRKR